MLNYKISKKQNVGLLEFAHMTLSHRTRKPRESSPDLVQVWFGVDYDPTLLWEINAEGFSPSLVALIFLR